MVSEFGHDEIDYSVQLHRREQVMHEPEWREESDCSSCEHDCKNHEEWITKVESGWDGSAQALKIEDKIINRVQEDV